MDKEDPFTPILWDRKRLDWCDLVTSPFCDLTAGQKLALIVLSSYGDSHGGNIFPSQKEIAFRSGLTERTVWAAVERATNEGWLVQYKHSRAGGFPRSSYDLAIPAGIQDATMFMKARFWTPPYKYKLVREGKAPRLISRAT